MSDNPFLKIRVEIDDAKAKINEAMLQARLERGEALVDNNIALSNKFKNIEMLLKSVLEG